MVNSVTKSKRPDKYAHVKSTRHSIRAVHGSDPADNIPIRQSIRDSMQGVSEYQDEHQILRECRSCGRSFNDQALAKHQKICKKVFIQKRKEFDSQGTRIVSEEQYRNLPKVNREIEKAKKISMSPPKRGKGQQMSKWKLQSMQFRMAMKAGRDIEPVSQP